MSNPVNQTDAVFLKRFSMMIAALVGLVIVMLLLAHYINGRNPTPVNPDRAGEVAARIAPVGGVYAGDTGRAAMQAAQEAATKAAASQVAYDGTTDGQTIYDKLCHSCHTTGVAGAPKLGTHADWDTRIAQGEETLLKHAIDGFTGKTGVMPARGGNPALSDEQMKAVVDWMMAQLK